MAQALKKYHTRAPRYQLQAGDRNVVRFAKVGQSHKSYSTTLVDISQSGVAFLCADGAKPKTGETIMIEFTVPGSEQMACYAEVMRVDANSDNAFAADNEAFVAVRFKDLLPTHRDNLSSGLQKKLRQVNSEKQMREFFEKIRLVKKFRYQTVFWILSAVAIVIIFYLLSQPRGSFVSAPNGGWEQSR